MASKATGNSRLAPTAAAYRTAAGLGKRTSKKAESVDDTPATGEVPVTGGETQPPGTETLPGTDAAAETAPERTEELEADVDGFGDQTGRVPQDDD
jgi:hypothetical protein